MMCVIFPYFKEMLCLGIPLLLECTTNNILLLQQHTTI